MTAPYRFTHAILRTPAPSAVKGIRADGGPDPDLAGLAAEHDAYAATLRALGLDLTILPPLDAFPDALFVEDVALTFPEGAILLRPGAATRAGEVEHVREALAAHHERVLELPAGHVDGGDVLRLADRVIIGLSARTDRAGAEQLAGLLAVLGHRAEIADTPPGVLHFKTGCGLIDAETIFAVPALAGCPEFAGLEIVVTPAGEEEAANLLRINDTILVGDRWTATHALLEARGLAIRPLPTIEIARIDAGLSCMSLRW
ncbi:MULTISPECIES: dimethylarginine dimethylaminohydrolase family protein [unclassified Sphingopyxis]|uniref:dimethylarginine dimethylaminohydrolase family protein n=1 Tax=unclassified Sphingopyxis TaxID=2614943 RepID=UPI000736C66D|nr:MULTISPECIES: arginine deiminase family protein [unclassified Sphingopyxis]KTE41908.1 dimethylarginine dimethylaminohydrolase [Sphingopyxis sp. HIX]KTE83596.1 dimethylarginine dimethylaminohydrolase [Sphingopyxis sp. HXXIV]